MSLPKDYALNLLADLSRNRVKNISAQTNARRILQEVNEDQANYPKFDPKLSEKAEHIAFAYLSAGCSLVENNNSDEGYIALERAGEILSDTHRFSPDCNPEKNNSLLLAGLALYASKQYSRSFIVLSDISADFSTGQMIVLFLKKDFVALTNLSAKILVSPVPKLSDIIENDVWMISREIARCFLLVEDYTYSGVQDRFRKVDEILNNLMELAAIENLSLYWLLIRLLKIVFSTLHSSSLWQVLPPFLPLTHLTQKYIQLLGGFTHPVTELWPSQTASLPLALGENNGAVINLRTSGGKTRVAELAILKTISTHAMGKVLYLAPFRSLAFEIEQSLSSTFSPLGIVVSQLYGNSTANVADFELINQSQIIIATPEKAKALIRAGSGIEENIKLIVIDEGHLLGEEQRYIRNEMFLTHIKEFASRNQIRLLLLSAVLPNAGELAQWIADDASLVARSEWKPALERHGLLLWTGNHVRLEWDGEGQPYNPRFVEAKPLGFGRRRNPFPYNKNEAIAASAIRLAQNGTVMIYSARANAVENLAKSTLLALGEDPEDHPWNPSIWSVFENTCKEELAEDSTILAAARKGIICHSNRLPTLVRIAIERLMRSKPPLVIIATSTLGQGVNVGISTVIVSSPYFSSEPISNRDFWNICGRAGRAFSDSEGKILYAIDLVTTKSRTKRSIARDQRLARDYFNSKHMEKVQSGLLIVLRRIVSVAELAELDVAQLIELVANDFTGYDSSTKLVKEVNQFFDYLDDELIAMNEDFSYLEGDLAWVDDVFRETLAIIQAEEAEKADGLQLIKARTAALLKRFPARTDRVRLVATGLPLSISSRIVMSLDYFREIALPAIYARNANTNWLGALDAIVRAIELWANEFVDKIVSDPPEQENLDSVRCLWLGGTALADIAAINHQIESISKDYYGFSLPWIVHAIAQALDKEVEREIVDLYMQIALLVEVGLPDETAATIFMAGIRSRSAALELSRVDGFKNMDISEVRQILIYGGFNADGVSDDTLAWVDLYQESFRSQQKKVFSVPSLKLNRNGLPDILKLYKVANKYYLMSVDGFSYVEVPEDMNNAVQDIAGIRGLYFERDSGLWKSRSNNPMILT